MLENKVMTTTPNNNKTCKKPWYKDKKKIFYYSLMALPLIQFCIFYIGVNFQSILLAFQYYDNMSDVEFKFLKGDIFRNFKTIYQNFFEYKVLSEALLNSVLLWFLSTFTGTVLAIFFSFYIFKRKKAGRIFRFILFLPSILPSMLLAIVFTRFTEDVLPIAIGVGKWIEGDVMSAKKIAILFYNLWVGFGTQVLLYSNAMEQISPSVTEACQLDGAKPMVEFFHIVLPEILGTVFTFMVASIASLFMNQANLFNFYGGQKDKAPMTLGYYMFYLVQSFAGGSGGKVNYPEAAALGICCTVIAVPLTLIFRKVTKRFVD